MNAYCALTGCFYGVHKFFITYLKDTSVYIRDFSSIVSGAFTKNLSHCPHTQTAGPETTTGRPSKYFFGAGIDILYSWYALCSSGPSSLGRVVSVDELKDCLPLNFFNNYILPSSSLRSLSDHIHSRFKWRQLHTCTHSSHCAARDHSAAVAAPASPPPARWGHCPITSTPGSCGDNYIPVHTHLIVQHEITLLKQLHQRLPLQLAEVTVRPHPLQVPLHEVLAFLPSSMGG